MSSYWALAIAAVPEIALKATCISVLILPAESLRSSENSVTLIPEVARTEAALAAESRP